MIGHARHQKILQHAIFNGDHALRRDAFIVKLIGARQPHPFSSFSVGSSVTLRNAGSTSWFTFLVNVCPSRLVPSGDALRAGAPKLHEKTLPAARPESIAGPAYGSAAGACARAFRSDAILSTLAASSVSDGSWSGVCGLKSFDAQQFHAIVGARFALDYQAAYV